MFFMDVVKLYIVKSYNGNKFLLRFYNIKTMQTVDMEINSAFRPRLIRLQINRPNLLF